MDDPGDKRRDDKSVLVAAGALVRRDGLAVETVRSLGADRLDGRLNLDVAGFLEGPGANQVDLMRLASQ